MKVHEHKSVTAARERLEEMQRKLRATEDARAEAHARAEGLRSQAVEADVAAEIGEGKAGVSTKLFAAADAARKDVDRLMEDADRKRIAVRILSERLHQAEAEAAAEVQRYHDKQVRDAVKVTAKTMREAEAAYTELKKRFGAAHDAGVKLPNPLQPGWEFVVAAGPNTRITETAMLHWCKQAESMGYAV